MTLQQKQEAERSSVGMLVESINKNASSLEELMKILVTYKDVRDDDPIPHIKRAMLSYIQEI